MMSNQLPGMERIRASFLKALVEREQALTNALDGIAQPASRSGSLSDIEFVVHKIAGTGGALGFAELGAKARTLEEAIGTWRKTGGPQVEVLAAMTRSFIGECRAVLA